MPSKTIYLDNAATTCLREEVVAVMTETLSHVYGNPSSAHRIGKEAKAIVEETRKAISLELNAQPSEIIFTSGGTEGNNMILRSAVRDCGVKVLITSRIEHHAVLHPCESLEKEYGITIEYVNLDEAGTPDLNHLRELLANTEEKKLVSLMHVNNEIGNILDIAKVGRICKKYGALFHSDTVQSVGHLRLDVKEAQVDFIVAAAHKFHGPKGSGFVYINSDVKLKPLIVGGSQERGHRSGTEAVHNVAGLKEAFVLAYQNLDREKEYIATLKRYFIDALKERINGVTFNGKSAHPKESTYTLVNTRLPIDKEDASYILFQLDLQGIACSRGSACQAGHTGGSHVLQEILTDTELEKPSFRFSFSKNNTKEELDRAISVLVHLVS